MCAVHAVARRRRALRQDHRPATPAITPPVAPEPRDDKPPESHERATSEDRKPSAELPHIVRDNLACHGRRSPPPERRPPEGRNRQDGREPVDPENVP